MPESEPRRDKSPRFGLFPFRSPLLRESLRFLFLRLLRCFTSAGFALSTLFIHVAVPALYRRWVSPFGYLRVKACLRLTEAFRSLPRPSSPCVAKASSCCPSLLDNNYCSFFKYGLSLDSIHFLPYSKLSYFLPRLFTCFLVYILSKNLKHSSTNPFMGPGGLEPPTPRLSSVCSNQLSYEPSNGGAERVRTDDLLNANQPLFQLSYGPFAIQRVPGLPI